MGERVRYRRLVAPSVDVMSPRTLGWLAEFVRGGGTMVFLHRLPMIAPDGSPLADAWREHFGFTPEEARIATDSVRELGRGRVHLLSDPADAITTSSPLHTGQVLELFDGTETMICMSRHFPHWIGVDLGRARRVSGVSVHCEAIKADILYRYRLEASGDGAAWREVASHECRGEHHTIAMDPIEARHLRLHVDTESERLYSIHALDITCEDASGRPALWRPPSSSPIRLAEVLPDALPELRWDEGDAPATSLVTHLRGGDGFRVHNLLNMSSRRKHLHATLPGGKHLSRWDLDTGGVEPVAVEAGVVRLALDAGEAVVLMETSEPAAQGAPVALDPRYEVVRSQEGPWPVQPERQNAFPLAAGKVWLRDADRGDEWIEAPEARLPAALRLTPNLAFRTEFECEWLNGSEDLHLEKWLYDHIRVNGQPLPEEPRTNHYYDCHGLSAPIGDLLKRGTNVIEGVWRPEMYERQADGQMYKAHNTQPAVDLIVLGRFGVRDGRVVAPVERLDGSRWEDQGFSYYSGTMRYDLDLETLEEGKRYALEIDARRCVVEVLVGDETVATLLAPPFRVELPADLAGSGRRVALKVTNSIASLFSAFHMGECFNQPIRNLASGLQAVTLLSIEDTPASATTRGRAEATA